MTTMEYRIETHFQEMARCARMDIVAASGSMLKKVGPSDEGPTKQMQTGKPLFNQKTDLVTALFIVGYRLGPLE